jgi:hypothetical protein
LTPCWGMVWLASFWHHADVLFNLSLFFLIEFAFHLTPCWRMVEFVCYFTPCLVWFIFDTMLKYGLICFIFDTMLTYGRFAIYLHTMLTYFNMYDQLLLSYYFLLLLLLHFVYVNLCLNDLSIFLWYHSDMWSIMFLFFFDTILRLWIYPSINGLAISMKNLFSHSQVFKN